MILIQDHGPQFEIGLKLFVVDDDESVVWRKYMKQLFVITLSVLALAGCATTRTKYQPHGNAGGYSEQKVDEKIMVARFSGNAYTHANDAMIFSQFRAIEICKDGGYKIDRKSVV